MADYSQRFTVSLAFFYLRETKFYEGARHDVPLLAYVTPID